MVRFLIAVAVVFAGVGLIFGASPTKTVKQGNLDVINIDGADSVGFTLSDKILIDEPGVVWRQIIGYVIIPAFTEEDSAIAGEGVLDTAVIEWYTGSGYKQTRIELDSCGSLPCTSFVEYSYYTVPSDTSGTGVLLGGDPYKYGLLYDHLWFRYRAADTAGTSGSLVSTPSYWFKLVGEK